MLHCMADTLLASDLEERSTGSRVSCTLKFPSLFIFRILRLRICQPTSPFFFFNFRQSLTLVAQDGQSLTLVAQAGQSLTLVAQDGPKLTMQLRKFLTF